MSTKNVGILNQSLMVVSLVEIITERGSQKLYKPIDVHSVTNGVDKIEVSSVFLAVKFFVVRW